MIALSQLYGEALAQGWPFVEPLLARALKPGDITTADLRKRADDGMLMIWALYEPAKPLPLKAAAAAGVQGSDGARVVVIQVLGGAGLTKWLDDAICEFENLAFEHDMSAVRIWGRKGWARLLPDYSVAATNTDGVVVLEKRIR